MNKHTIAVVLGVERKTVVEKPCIMLKDTNYECRVNEESHNTLADREVVVNENGLVNFLKSLGLTVEYIDHVDDDESWENKNLKYRIEIAKAITQAIYEGKILGVKEIVD